jgi:predicted alpha/beta-fold hydrolase
MNILNRFIGLKYIREILKMKDGGQIALDWVCQQQPG